MLPLSTGKGRFPVQATTPRHVFLETAYTDRMGQTTPTYLKVADTGNPSLGTTQRPF